MMGLCCYRSPGITKGNNTHINWYHDNDAVGLCQPICEFVVMSVPPIPSKIKETILLQAFAYLLLVYIGTIRLSCYCNPVALS